MRFARCGRPSTAALSRSLRSNSRSLTSKPRSSPPINRRPETRCHGPLLIVRPPTVVQPMVVRLLLLGLGNEMQSLMLERLRLGTGGGPPVVDTKIVVRLLLQKSGVLGERSTIVLNRAHTLEAGFFGGAEDGRCRAGLDLCKHGTHRQSHSRGFGSVR